jgi:CRISPR-associated protein Csh2
MNETEPTLTSRRELLFLYDIKMGNPNGDPDENRPRVLPDGTHYVTDVRLKRFVRDYLKSQNEEILVDTIEGKTTNLTGRVAHYLARAKLKKVEDPREIVSILLKAFTDARLFGSSFAFGEEKGASRAGQESDREAKPAEDEADDSTVSEVDADAEGGVSKKGKGKEKKDKEKKVKSKLVSASVSVDGSNQLIQWAKPKTLTGAVQFQHGEVKHAAREVDIYGTSVFGSAEEKTQGTFTSYFGLRYALIAFHGVANEHSAKLSRMTDADYDTMLKALWNGVRSAANTRTKRGQVPHLLLSVEYKAGEEFQFGRLSDYVKLLPRNGKLEADWATPEDYTIDLSTLINRLATQMQRIERIRYCVSPDVVVSPTPESVVGPAPESKAWDDLAFDTPSMERNA